MPSMSKRPVMPDVMRSLPFVPPGENVRFLARAPELWLATTVECYQELTEFVSKRLGKDGEALRAIVG